MRQEEPQEEVSPGEAAVPLPFNIVNHQILSEPSVNKALVSYLEPASMMIVLLASRCMFHTVTANEKFLQFRDNRLRSCAQTLDTRIITEDGNLNSFMGEGTVQIPRGHSLFISAIYSDGQHFVF